MDDEKKKFIFPENISNEYGVFMGLSLREVVTYLLPILVIGILLLLFPPHNLTWIFGKLIFIILVFTVALAVLTSTPIANRTNIRLPQYLRMKSSYRNRQHIFYLDKKKRR